MLSDMGTKNMYVLSIERDTICSVRVILVVICYFCGLGRPLHVKHRANIDLRAFDLWWRRPAETCRVSLLFMLFFLGIYISFWHVRGNNVPLMHFDLIQPIRDSDYRYLFHPRKLKCAYFAPSWTVLEGPSVFRRTFSYTFDFSHLTVMALTHFPTGWETLLSWYALQQVICVRKPYPLLASNATECFFGETSQ